MYFALTSYVDFPFLTQYSFQTFASDFHTIFSSPSMLYNIRKYDISLFHFIPTLDFGM